MSNKNTKEEQRLRRRMRIRSKVFGTPDKPRLSVFKSNRYLSAQIIDDTNGITLVSGSTASLEKGTPLEKVETLAEQIVKSAKDKKVSKIVFDRGGYIFTGRIKAFADAIRKAGLKF